MSANIPNARTTMTESPEELAARNAAEHLRIQASLVRCDDCGRYFRDIDKHVAESVTVPASEPVSAREMADIAVYHYG